jgi:hypothetical protein
VCGTLLHPPPLVPCLGDWGQGKLENLSRLGFSRPVFASKVVTVYTSRNPLVRCVWGTRHWCTMDGNLYGWVRQLDTSPNTFRWVVEVYVPQGPPQESPVVFGFIEVSWKRYIPNINRCIHT